METTESILLKVFIYKCNGIIFIVFDSEKCLCPPVSPLRLTLKLKGSTVIQSEVARYKHV